MKITKSKLEDIIREEIRLTEAGKFKLSPRAEMQWHGNTVIIISGNKRIVLNRKELTSILTAADRHRLGEGKLNESNFDILDIADLAGDLGKKFNKWAHAMSMKFSSKNNRLVSKALREYKTFFATMKNIL